MFPTPGPYTLLSYVFDKLKIRIYFMNQLINVTNISIYILNALFLDNFASLAMRIFLLILLQMDK